LVTGSRAVGMAGNWAKPADAAARPSPNITGKTARIRLEKHMRANSKHRRFTGKVFSSRIFPTPEFAPVNFNQPSTFSLPCRAEIR